MLLDPSNATAASSFAYGGATACPASRLAVAGGANFISAMRIPSLDMQILQYVNASNTTKTTAGSAISTGAASADTTTSITASSSTSTMGMCGGYGPVANAPAERGRRLAVVWTGHNDYLGLLRQIQATAASSTLSAGAAAPASAGATGATTETDPAAAANSVQLGDRPVSAAAVADSPAELIKRVVGCVVEGASALVRSGCMDGVVVWALAPLHLAPGVPRSLRSVASVIERQHNALLASAMDHAGLAQSEHAWHPVM